ncbi:MAG: VCBS repeat-containing protein, partial [Acidimicrobiia bacterium]
LLLGGPGGFTVDREFPGARGRTSGAVFVDLDGDGALDLVVARNVRDAPRGRAPSEVLRNLGDGKFERATTFDEPAGARAIGVLDFDADGRDDLFVLEDRWSGSSSVLLHNEGGFRFRDVTADRGLPLHLEGLGVSTADVTGDGRPDLFVSGSNRLFVATADGTFDGANSSVFAWQSHGSEDDPGGVAAGDLDGDGRIDLVVGQHFGSTTDQDRRVPVRVFMNHAGPTSDRPRFEELGARAGLDGLRSRAPHVEIADFDADGRPDILVGVATDAGVPLVYRNVGGVGSDLTFEAVAPQHGVEYWAAGVVADFDHDGRLDVALASFDASRPSVLVRNTASSGHWWAIAARAGAAVTLHDPSGNETRATVSGSTGFSSGPAPIAWFGLATATRGRATVQFADGTHAAVVLRSDTLVRLDC